MPPLRIQAESLMKKTENIIISGMPASGKSTLAKKLAKKYGLEYLDAGNILKKMNREFRKEHRRKDFWESEAGEKFALRRLKTRRFDEQLDRQLASLLDKGGKVLTSYTMPWLYKGKAVKIWIRASQAVRASRLAERDKISLREALKLIQRRDENDFQIYKKHYKIELGKDLSPFDYIIDSEDLNAKQVEKAAVNLIGAKP